MEWILPILMLVIMLACVVLTLSSGLWGNLITLINVITAALIATNYYEPLAAAFDDYDKTYRYLSDFLSVWVIFIAVLAILRVLTDLASKVKVRFKKPLEIGGGLFFGVWIGWIMVSFIMFTLHMAPLSQNFLFGAFQEKPDTHMFFGLGPDRKWLAFVHGLSSPGGSLATGTSANKVFDPEGKFILKYGERRKDYESKMDVLVKPQ
ncbi:MAG: CvpA family protein [Planctomycetota bacterium]|nr:CvpA family protein [Planctomycetota bacterium]